MNTSDIRSVDDCVKDLRAAPNYWIDTAIVVAFHDRFEFVREDCPDPSALLSSFEDTPVSQRLCFAGEVGLSGEIRAVNRIDQRIVEAEKLGFEKIIVSKYNQKSLSKQKFGIEVVMMGRVEEVYKNLF